MSVFLNREAVEQAIASLVLFVAQKPEEQIFFNLLTFDRDCGILKAERIFEFIDDLL